MILSMQSELYHRIRGVSLRCYVWRSQCRWRLVKASLQAAYEMAEKNEDIELAYAWFLYQRGDQSGARQIISRLPHIRFEEIRDHDWGYSDVTFTIRLRRLQELLGVPEGTIPRCCRRA